MGSLGNLRDTHADLFIFQQSNKNMLSGFIAQGNKYFAVLFKIIGNTSSVLGAFVQNLSPLSKVYLFKSLYYKILEKCALVKKIKTSKSTLLVLAHLSEVSECRYPTFIIILH